VRRPLLAVLRAAAPRGAAGGALLALLLAARGDAPAGEGRPARPEGAVRMEEVEVRGKGDLPPYLPEPVFDPAPAPAPDLRGLAEEEARRPLPPPPPEPAEGSPNP
jgi:hypothetical protein